MSTAVAEEKKTETKDGKPEEQVHARHILISEAANPFGGPPQTGRQKAKNAVEQDKAKKILDEIVARSHVTVADSYSVKPPEQQPMQGLPPGFGPGGQPQQEPPPAQEQPKEKPKAPPKPHK